MILHQIANISNATTHNNLNELLEFTSISMSFCEEGVILSKMKPFQSRIGKIVQNLRFPSSAAAFSFSGPLFRAIAIFEMRIVSLSKRPKKVANEISLLSPKKEN